MIWFKWLLIGLLFLSAIANLTDAHRGGQSRKINGKIAAISVVVNTVLAFGVWLWL